MSNPMQILDQHISFAINHYSGLLEKYFNCDVLAYLGSINPMYVSLFLEKIELLIKHQDKQSQENPRRLVIMLTTNGGVVEAVEKMVEITRYHYDEVYFIIPDSAMSAGTIWAMSGDKIYMDYASSLGPIDPQVPNQDGIYIPALGYIDKINEFIDKSKKDKLTNAEYMLLKSLDLGTIRRFEQARELSVSLLKDWLVRYKFKDWEVHRTTNPGSEVTLEEKTARANEIANQLSDNKLWHSHGRMIGISTLRNTLKLEITDYSEIEELRSNIRMYNGLLSAYFEKNKFAVIIHNRRI